MNTNLFHSKTLNNTLGSFTFPLDLNQKHKQINEWIKALEKGTLDEIKEISLHGQFLNDIFQKILNYRSVIEGQGENWEIHAEPTLADGGGTADGALGFFTAIEATKGKIKLKGRIVAPIELKGAKTDLDRPIPGRKESAVDQGWRYANYTSNCNWIIVSNYRELRLYQTSKTPAYYERFYLKDLADLNTFKRFYFLLCRQNFLPPHHKPEMPSKIDILLAQSNEAEEAITKQLYQEYKQLRIDLVDHFRSKSSVEVPNREAMLIEKAQKTLDRLLFIAFCEDRGLLPTKTLSHAHEHQDPYHPRPIWENYKAVFRWVDRGNDNPPIPGYNGGLFKHDSLLDQTLTVPNVLCSQMKELTRFDFETEVSVNILGHIFEQSVTDLEELRALATGEKYNQKKGKRKVQGVFYTPAYITQYIVGVALGRYLDRREQEMRDRFGLESISQKDTEIQFWQAYRDRVLKQTRVIDPACGSGAFLIAAFDYLLRQYERVNQALAALEGEQMTRSELYQTILTHNLYGVDLSPESVEITKLSLWLQTAERGKTLTDLEHNIKVGNSIVADASVDSRAFNWEAEFPEVFADGGFDVAIGNPPYVRQELLSSIKPYLQQHYQSYDGVADLYTYFYEKGLKLLKSDGILSYIVTNKWLRAGYGESLRKFFTENSIFEEIIDFGHAPIFEEADTFPCIVVTRKLFNSPSLIIPVDKEEKLVEISPVLICPVPREKLLDINLPQYVQQEGYQVPWYRFTADAWSLEPLAVNALMQKIKDVGVSLKDFAGVKPLYGIKTGFNEAFLIDDETRNKLVQADLKAAEIIKPYLRGQDIKRWSPEWQNLWMIFTRRGTDINAYPSVKNHLSQYRKNLEPRPEDWDKNQDGDWHGRKPGSYQWYEIQDTVDYWKMFEKPKIIYQVIQTLPQYAFDNSGVYGNDKTFIFPKSDLYLLGCLNSPLLWWYSHRIFTKMLSGAISPMGYLFETLPIALPTDTIRSEVESIVARLIEITKTNQQAYRDVLDWLRIEHNIEKPGKKLEDFASLKLDEFVEEIKKRKPKSARSLSVTALRAVKEAYHEYVPTLQFRQAEVLKLEHRLSDLVNQAYQLTSEEIELMWKTAPPRMPNYFL